MGPDSKPGEPEQPITRAGYVSLIGRPNAGKSTLLNHLIGQKVAAVSDKPQTTRTRILGIRTLGNNQFLFVDTPGIHRPGYRMNERMMETVYEAVKGVDVVVHLVDASESFGKGEQYVLDLLKQGEKPVVLALNKVDLINKGKLLPMMEFFSQQKDYAAIIPLSALTGENVEGLLDEIGRLLPEGEFLYPADYLTDQHERFIVAEIIREKVLSHTREELPYATAVRLDEFDESQRDDGFVKIFASIIVDKDSQKKIVIGRAGQMIKQIGIEARQDIESFLGIRKLYLDLNVKVVPGWRNLDQLLDEMWQA
ncbi:MAG: GTPase Era [Acidobacteria bacterium]|nr:MAG: GTPase Era [Acidobacteriota bacterium]